MGVTAIILAAGRGSRLHPYTAECPKCLTELGGLSLIDRHIATLRAAGIQDIVIAAGYRAEMLQLPQTRQVINSRWAETNMVETLFAAEAAFGDDLIVAYSDIVYEPRVIEALLGSPHATSVVVDRKWKSLWEVRFDDPLSDAESLTLDAYGLIRDIGNKVTDIDTIDAQYIGLMRFRGAGISAMRNAYKRLCTELRPWNAKRPPEKAYMTDLLSEMIAGDLPVHAVVTDGGWIEVDTIRDYETYADMFADGSIRRFYDPSGLVKKLQ